MRRSEKQITDRTDIDEIIRGSRACHLAMCDGQHPYVVPLCFGYDGSALYFHCAREGRKIDILCKNPKVCVEFDIPGDTVEADEACVWGLKYRSVIAIGRAELIESAAEKREGLRCLMNQYAPSRQSWSFPDAAVDRVTIVKVLIEEITGRQSV